MISWIVIGAMFLVFIAIRFHFFSLVTPPTEAMVVQRVCIREHRDCATVVGTTRIRSQADITLLGSAVKDPVAIGDLVVRFPDIVFIESMN